MSFFNKFSRKRHGYETQADLINMSVEDILKINPSEIGFYIKNRFGTDPSSGKSYRKSPLTDMQNDALDLILEVKQYNKDYNLQPDHSREQAKRAKEFLEGKKTSIKSHEYETQADLINMSVENILKIKPSEIDFNIKNNFGTDPSSGTEYTESPLTQMQNNALDLILDIKNENKKNKLHPDNPQNNMIEEFLIHYGYPNATILSQVGEIPEEEVPTENDLLRKGVNNISDVPKPYTLLEHNAAVENIKNRQDNRMQKRTLGILRQKELRDLRQRISEGIARRHQIEEEEKAKKQAKNPSSPPISSSTYAPARPIYKVPSSFNENEINNIDFENWGGRRRKRSTKRRSTRRKRHSKRKTHRRRK
jgi:hypothetical protein